MLLILPWEKKKKTTALSNSSTSHLQPPEPRENTTMSRNHLTVVFLWWPWAPVLLILLPFLPSQPTSPQEGPLSSFLEKPPPPHRWSTLPMGTLCLSDEKKVMSCQYWPGSFSQYFPQVLPYLLLRFHFYCCGKQLDKTKQNKHSKRGNALSGL